MLTWSSRWVDAVETTKRDTGGAYSDDGAAVDVCHATGCSHDYTDMYRAQRHCRLLDHRFVVPPRPPRLGEGVSPLDLATIKDFLRFHVAISRGRIDDERITVDSVNTFAEWFFAGFARVTGNTINEEDRRAVYDVSAFWIEL